MSQNQEPTEEDVLDNFAVEENRSLEQYIKRWPQYAEALRELDTELNKPEELRDLTPEDFALIDKAWREYKRAPVK